MEKEFKWATRNTPVLGEPRTGEIAEVTIPVKVIFEWSDKIVADVDEFNNPVEFRSGYIMKILPDQVLVYKDQKRLPIAFTTTEK
jgi:hypothetical protein